MIAYVAYVAYGLCSVKILIKTRKRSVFYPYVIKSMLLCCYYVIMSECSHYKPNDTFAILAIRVN